MSISTPTLCKSEFKTIGIIGKYGDADVSETIALVIHVIDELGANVLIDSETIREYELTNPHHLIVDRETLARESDLIITVGGDGSFLAASRSAVAYDKPIIGVNMGRLGFLTDISPTEIKSVLFEVMTGKFQSEQRIVLSAQVVRKGKVIASQIGINDVIIHKRSVARMIELDVYIDNRFLSSYFADGLLVPICPHTLTHRPIVLDARLEQRIEISENNDANLQISIDGQKEIPLIVGDSVLITQYSRKLNIYHPCDYDQLRRLRRKLGWGSEPTPAPEV